jgi:hypothetical protein
MPLSMRTLLATDTQMPEAVRAGIAGGNPESVRQLVALGVNECEAAELLDEPCCAAEGTAGEPRHSR